MASRRKRKDQKKKLGQKVEKIKKTKAVGWCFLIPLLFAVAVVPLIVHMRVVPLEGAAYAYWTGEPHNVDFFSYYKSIWLVVSAALALAALLVVLYEKQLVLKKVYFYYIPLAVYALFVFLSTIFAEHGEIALRGFPDRCEGMWVLFSYIVLVFVTVNMVTKEKHLKIILGSLFASAFVIGMIGIFQYLGHDLFATHVGKSLILPAEFHHLKDEITFTFERRVYGTLYNPNFVGSYMAMMLPFPIIFFAFSKGKKTKLGMAFFALIILANLYGSGSRAGLVAITVVFAVLAIILRRQVFKHWRYLLAGTACAAVVLLALNVILQGQIVQRAGAFLKWERLVAIADPHPGQLRDVVMSEDGQKVMLATSEGGISFLAAAGGEGSRTNDTGGGNVGEGAGRSNLWDLQFKGDCGRELDFTTDPESGRVTFADPDYAVFDFAVQGDIVSVGAGVREQRFNFQLAPERIYFINHRDERVILEPVERWGFEGLEGLGSARGHNWSRTFPLLRDTILWGHGPDTFAIYFPQHDYIGKALWHYDMGIIVDKPHNFYLQVAVNTGLASLIALLVLFAGYSLTSIRLYINRREYDDIFAAAGLALFAAFCGYAVAALFNDSLVSVAPVFWVLFGLGIACNEIVRQR